VLVEMIDNAAQRGPSPEYRVDQRWDFVVLYAGHLSGRGTSAVVPGDVMPEGSAHTASVLKA